MKRIDTKTADKSLRQWEHLVKSEDCKGRSKEYENLAKSNPDKRPDVLYRELLGGKDEFKELYSVVKLVLILSHGNAKVEHGFSINKQILKDNMLERSLVAQRIVHQAIPKQGRKFLDIEIDGQMIADVRGASRRRVDYLKKLQLEKSDEERSADQKKRKLSEIQELEARKKIMIEEKRNAVRDIEQQIDNLRKM